MKYISNPLYQALLFKANSWIAWYKTKLARHGNNDVTVTQSKIPYR
ncbi:hypothetical protein IMCC3317_06890 [Kordia antarctica]|uniref:Uncharacterized protein n=1 Tax=Kordia antarctica TaxID=1218801 RepID=A0A7L4ZF88_9FLAO|nr:hypothetical protein IMCC3317_06890 [Kordia antarctica]